MRVLYFTEQDSPHDRRFLNALAATDHEVFSLRMNTCQPETPAGITELAWQGGQPDWTNWQGWQRGKAKLIDILSELQPDLIHAGPVQGPALVVGLAGFHPLVTMSWGYDLLRIAKRSPWMRYATRTALAFTDILLVDCQTVADEAVRYGFSSEKVVRFPWGVDLAHFSPNNADEAGLALKQSLGWEDQFVLFCNRSWEPPYGVDMLAQAFVRASNVHPELRLLLAGGGTLSERIRHILAPVIKRVHFPGWVDLADLPSYYGAGDVFVSPSHCDGSSISLLEALACGRPTLVSDIPSNREWVTPGEVGEWFTDGDITSLESQLLRLAADLDISEYGKRARLLAEDRADWDINFQKCLSAYQTALA
jgi:glycosyltransferase involved in cell wall biosynthesis